MSDDQSSYRPRSPDFSAFDSQQHHQPPPRLNRLPSYQIQEPSLPKGYSFSPRGSYDASPFFSPVIQQPPPSYFNFPTVTSPQTATNVASKYPSQQFAETSPQQSHSPPRLSHQITGDPSYQDNHFTAPHHSPRLHSDLQSQHLDDMARLRQRKPVNYNENYNGPFEHENSSPLPITKPTQARAQVEEPHFLENIPTTTVNLTQQNLALSGPMVVPKVDVRTKFPVARIKRIMQADEDVGKVAQATPSAVSKALELFMIALVTKGATEAKSQNSKRVTATHLKNALLKDPQFDFLNEVCESAPDEGSKKRVKGEAKDSDSEDEGDGKRKSKARRKKTGSELESD